MKLNALLFGILAFALSVPGLACETADSKQDIQQEAGKNTAQSQDSNSKKQTALCEPASEKKVETSDKD